MVLLNSRQQCQTDNSAKINTVYILNFWSGNKIWRYPTSQPISYAYNKQKHILVFCSSVDFAVYKFLLAFMSMPTGSKTINKMSCVQFCAWPSSQGQNQVSVCSIEHRSSFCPSLLPNQSISFDLQSVKTEIVLASSEERQLFQM